MSFSVESLRHKYALQSAREEVRWLEAIVRSREAWASTETAAISLLLLKGKLKKARKALADLEALDAVRQEE